MTTYSPLRARRCPASRAIYFNLRTGESFNTYTVNKDIKEGEQINRTDWDLAFCGYTMRTNSGTSGIGQGGAADLGYGGYDD